MTTPSTSNNAMRRVLGMAMASIFTFAYIIAPTYILISLLVIIFRWPTFLGSILIASPVIISALIPPISSPWMLKQLTPMLDYFHYEQIIEEKPIDVRQNMKNGKVYIIAAQPHGVVSLCGMCSGAIAEKSFQGTLPTGVAEAVLMTPILKHILGVFNLISASKSSLVMNFHKGGIEGSVVLYVGGMAELFLSSEKEETLYLKKRKGFIKLALQTGVDVVPLYLFGNTTCLSVFKTGFLANLSRKMQVSLTYFWGRWFLPIPRNVEMLYVGGQPLGMPRIENPSQEDIDKWHDKYLREVTRIFDTYKERVPAYKHKKLVIV